MIQGHSGFTVQLPTGDQTMVRKTAPTVQHFQRLCVQMAKQNHFAKALADMPGVSVPTASRSDGLAFVMPFCRGMNWVEFLSVANTDELNFFRLKIVELIAEFVRGCELIKINRTIFEEKIYQVERNYFCRHRQSEEVDGLFRTLRGCFAAVKFFFLPIGVSHGDMTLSNMILDPNMRHLYLFDFLDTFIETPLHDMIKLRQDTRFHWVLNRYGLFQMDVPRIHSALLCLDTFFDEQFKSFAFYQEYYRPMQALNLFRVLQYSQDDDTHGFLIAAIQEIL